MTPPYEVLKTETPRMSKSAGLLFTYFPPSAPK